MCPSSAVSKAAHTSNSLSVGLWWGAPSFELLGFGGMAYSLTFKRLEVNYAASHVCGSPSRLHSYRTGIGGRNAGDALRRATDPDNQGADEIAALRNGEGMGMAKAAELNGYPGPIHVLALVAQLGLTESQHREVTAIFERMSAAAKLLGGELIARERTLNKLFATGEVTPNRLSAETAAIGELQGRLRSVHLAAHLQIRALLNPEQIVRYKQLRGYGEPTPVQHHHHG